MNTFSRCVAIFALVCQVALAYLFFTKGIDAKNIAVMGGLGWILVAMYNLASILKIP